MENNKVYKVGRTILYYLSIFILAIAVYDFWSKIIK
jgi:hypothetical protein